MSKESLALAKTIRLRALEMVTRSNSSHIGSGLSCADILAVLYADILKLDPANPAWPERDRFILSKGHAVAPLYVALAERGFFLPERLETFGETGGLPGHASHHVPGIEASMGSLGHGLPIACGMALANPKTRVFVLMGDGESSEGSVWEAMLFAPHHKLSNLCAIIDSNKLFSCGTVADVLDLAPLAEKGRAFGWDVAEIDGHDHKALDAALRHPSPKPRLIVANTIKGKGVPFMEGKVEWHFKSPKPDQLAEAQQAVEASDA